MIEVFTLGSLYGIGLCCSVGLIGNFVYGLIQLVKGGQSIDD